MLHACVLTYMSDMSTGLIPFESDEGEDRRASLDHARLGSTGGPWLDDWSAGSTSCRTPSPAVAAGIPAPSYDQ